MSETRQELPTGIVVGVDGSEHADDALEWAWLESAALGADLTAVSTWDAPWLTAPTSAVVLRDGSVDEVARAEQARADDAVSRVRARLEASANAAARAAADTVSVRATQAQGPAVPTLMEVAAHASMLVVGRTGRGRIGRMFMGSVSLGLARNSTVPVTIVPSGWRASEGTGRGGRVVVGVDGSAASRLAIEHALACVRQSDSELEAVGCWQLLSVGPLPHGQGWAPPIEDYEQHVEEMVRETVAAAVHRAGALPAPQISVVVEHALPAAGLLKHAEGATRLIVGNRGLGGFDRLLLGSVSTQLVEHSPCPVTVIRSASVG